MSNLVDFQVPTVETQQNPPASEVMAAVVPSGQIPERPEVAEQEMTDEPIQQAPLEAEETTVQASEPNPAATYAPQASPARAPK